MAFKLAATILLLAILLEAGLMMLRYPTTYIFALTLLPVPLAFLTPLC